MNVEDVDYSRIEAHILAHYVVQDEHLHRLWWQAAAYGAGPRKRMEIVDFARMYGPASPRPARTPPT